MLENQNMSAPIKLAEGYNPFGDEVFVQQAQPAVDVAPTATDEQQSAQVAPQEETKPQEQPPAASGTTFDPNQFVKEKFGYDSVEQAEEEFKKFKEKPSDFEFKDNVSKTLFDAIKEGKADDVYDILNPLIEEYYYSDEDDVEASFGNHNMFDDSVVFNKTIPPYFEVGPPRP